MAHDWDYALAPTSRGAKQMIFIIVMNIVSMGFGNLVEPDGIDRAQLVRLMQSARSDMSDFVLEYEGEVEYPPPEDRSLLHPNRLQGVTETYTGAYARRSDGATRVDIYVEEPKTNVLRRHTVVNLNGKTESRSGTDIQKNSQITIRATMPQSLPGTSSYARIWLGDVVLGLARSSVPYRFEGMQQVEGRSCAVVRFAYNEAPETPRANVMSNVFWIDLERGAHVLRHEHRWGDDVMETTTLTNLREVRSPSGKTGWLPVAGEVRGYMTVNLNLPEKPRMFTTQPVRIETYHVIDGSLRMERRLGDDFFSIKGNPGDVVSDELKKAQYEYGQYMVRSRNDKPKLVADSEIQQNLEMMLNDSQVMARELKASSPARDGPGWVDVLPWGVAVLAALTLIGYLVHRRFVA